ncbi:hypothetical protein FBZ81_10120 [Azospirillum brasilense]|nr:hypothetical protein OH82_05681 [Azospirillum brasilense]TWB86096.1 hypothetical protein FBZ81_10120 [Azospirillum brasilense]
MVASTACGTEGAVRNPPASARQSASSAPNSPLAALLADLSNLQIHEAFDFVSDTLSKVYIEWPELASQEAKTIALKRKVKKLRWSSLNIHDYKDNAIDFNKAYYPKNLSKCAVVASALQLLHSEVVYDVGGGAGPFGTMWKHYHPDSKVIVVDRSIEQESIGKKISSIIGINIDYEHGDASNYFTEEKTRGIRIFSYFLCEQMPEFASIRWDTLIGECGIFVDYGEVLGALRNIPKSFSVNYASASVKVPNSLVSFVGDKQLDVNVAVVQRR